MISKIELAKKYENDNNWDEAIKLYEEVIEKDNSNNILERLGWCQSRVGKYDAAIKTFSELKNREPKIAKWSYMIGYQYYCKKAWRKAVDYFEDALKIKPNYFIVKYRIAYAYIQLAGSYKRSTKPEYWKAIAHLEECQRIWANFDEQTKEKEKNTYFDINFFHGKIIMELPKYREYAITRLKKALEIKEDDNCRYNLSKVYYLIGQYEESKKNLPNNNNYYVVELKAYVEAKVGNYDVAIDITEKLIKKRKKDYLFSFLSEVFLLKGENKKAYFYVKKALTLNFNNHKNHYVLAKVYYKLNLCASALNELKLAIDLKIKNYKSNYEEAINLKKEIEKLIKDDYIEDKSVLEALDKNINVGKIYKYNKEKGYGFIQYNEKNVFFHISDCEFSNPRVGSCVGFEISIGTNNMEKAINICIKN